jgi:GT2 family glycosyltransferase
VNGEATTVIICTHRVGRWPWLVRAVESVEQQTVPASRIVVVVDGDAALGELAARELSDRCLVVERPECGGLSAARNSGLEVVQTPLVAFLDDDAEAEPTWLAELSTLMVDDSVLGVGGCSVPEWDGSVPPWFPEELFWVLGCTYRGLPTRVAEIRNVFGGCAIYRADLFTATGGFNELLGRKALGLDGCEETELCLRAKAHFPSGKFLFAPAAVIHHHVPADRVRLSYVLRRSYGEGRSKAVLAKLVSSAGKLRPEVRYLRSTITRCIAGNLVRAVSEGLDPLRSAGIVVLSICAAALGYASASVEYRDREALAGRSALGIRPSESGTLPAPPASRPGAGTAPRVSVTPK